MNDHAPTHYLPVRMDTTGAVYWQATTEPGGEGQFLGLFDDDGDRVDVGNASWSVVTPDDCAGIIFPPFAE